VTLRQAALHYFPPRSRLPALMLGAAALKLSYLVSYVGSNPFARFMAADAAYYADWAHRINEQGWLGEGVFYRAPLYPYLLSVCFAATGGDALGVYILQLLMGLGILALVYRIATRLFGGRAGLLAALLVLGYAPFTFCETKLLPTVTEMALGLLSVDFLLRAELDEKTGCWIAGSTTLGLAIVSRPTYALVVPILAAMLGWRLWRRPRVLVPALASLVLVPAMFVAAVATRNYVVGNDLVLVSANGGVTFAQGNNPRARGSMAVLPGFSGAVETQQQEETALAEAALGRSLAPSEVSAYWLRQGLHFIRDEPTRYLRLLGDKAALIVNNREFGSNYLLSIDKALSPVLQLAFLPFGLLLGTGLLGIYAMLRERRTGSAVLAVFAGAVLMMLLFYVNTRYRMTLAPVTAVLAGGGLDRLLASRRDLGRLSAMLGVVGVVFALSLPPLLPFDDKEIRRGDADYWANLGVAYGNTGHPELAIEAYDRAIALSPRTYRHYQGRTAALGASNADPAALANWIQRVAEEFPQEYTAQMSWAKVMEALGREDAAIEGYRRTIALEPRVTEAWVRLGALYCAHGEAKPAREVLAEALRRFPENADVKRLAAEGCSDPAAL